MFVHNYVLVAAFEGRLLIYAEIQTDFSGKCMFANAVDV